MESHQKFVQECVEKYRKKLLDTSKRNNLISFSHSERSRQHVRVIDELPDFLYQHLIDGKAFTFAPLPEEDKIPHDEQTEKFRSLLEQGKLTDEGYLNAMDEIDEDDEGALDAIKKIDRVLRNKIRQELGLIPLGEQKGLSNIEVAKKHGINPSYEMPMPTTENLEKAEKHTDKYIQMLLKPEEMTRTLSGLVSYVKTDIDETGVNTLYISFGFLQWYESKSSSKPCTSPLFLLQLEVEKKQSKEGYTFKVQATGEEPEINLSLSERLKKDFGFELPEFSENDTPETYMENVAKTIKTANVPKKDMWRVRRYITIGRFRFARLVMFHDLNPVNWPGNSEVASNAVIQKLFSGASEANINDNAEDYHIDTEEVEGIVPLLITSADASQHSALVDVMKGHNLAIKGPPGTGKSQTITNIIANALAKGKTVLFLAEKMAALNVVHERLSKAGLGPFCLELHSTKAKKTEILKSLEDRLNHITPKSMTDLAAKVREFKKHRDHLGEYIEILNSKFGAQNKTVHDYLWAAQLRRERTEPLPPSIRQVKAPFIQANLNDTQMSSHIEDIHLLIKLKNEVDEDSSNGTHPWGFMQNLNLNPFQQEEFKNHVLEWKTNVVKLLAANDAIKRNYALPFDDTVTGLEYFAVNTKKLSEYQVEKLNAEILGKLDNISIANDFLAFVNAVKTLNEILPDIEAVRDVLTNIEHIDELKSLVSEAKIQNVQEDSFSTLRSKIADLIELKKFLLGNLKLLQDAGQNLGISLEDTFDKVFDFIEVPGYVASVPREYLLHRNKEVLDETNTERLKSAYETQVNVRNSLRNLEHKIDLKLLGDPHEIRTFATIIESAGFFSFFDANYRKAKRAYKLAHKIKVQFNKSHCVATFKEIATTKENWLKIENDVHLKNICGINYRGLETDFEKLTKINEWAIEVKNRFSSPKAFTRNIRNWLLTGNIDDLDSLRELSKNSDFQDFKNQVAGIKTKVSPDTSVQKHIESLSDNIENLSKLSTELNKFASNSDVTISDLDRDIPKIERLKAIYQKINSLSTITGIFAESYKGAQTDVDSCSKEAEFLEHFIESKILRSSFNKFFHSDFQSSWQEFIKLRTTTVDMLSVVKKAGHIVDEYGTPDFSGYSEAVTQWQETNLEIVLKTLERAIINPDTLGRWIKYSAHLARVKCDIKGDLVQAYLDENLNLESLPVSFEYMIYSSIAKEIYNTYPQIKNFNGHGLSQARARLKELDEEIIALQQISLNKELTNARLLSGNSSGSRTTWTEGPLIHNEISKQKRHIPTRDLLLRAGSSIQKIKPCLLMSPLTVAQYLQPGKFTFDLIVIDEASQMRPEDALGGVARAKQIVVVGDPQQLPPTSFFQQNAKDDDEELEDFNSDAIMDMALSSFRPARILSRHYRSQHESLIEFSNYHFYERSLILFPSPVKNPDELGVRLEFVGGTYASSSNMDEVQAITKAALDFMRRYPDRSLGIATMNQVQKELIEAEMDKAFIEHAHAAKYKVRWQDTLESFFVKNLESVQGDERDAIFISTVYGPDKSGVVVQKFGPINKAGGYRRLNVLFTRSKKNMVVFTSLKPEDIKISDSSSDGLKAFRGFLAFASKGILEHGEMLNEEPDSDFEVWVKERLESIGCEVHPQVGVAGYKIDLGVKHPKYPYGYLLGIECDGAAYHSSKSARERDIIRQQVLENLGWKIYRIWSTDWFSQPAQEFERLKQYIEKLLHENGQQQANEYLS